MKNIKFILLGARPCQGLVQIAFSMEDEMQAIKAMSLLLSLMNAEVNRDYENFGKVFQSASPAYFTIKEAEFFHNSVYKNNFFQLISKYREKPGDRSADKEVVQIFNSHK